MYRQDLLVIACMGFLAAGALFAVAVATVLHVWRRSAATEKEIATLRVLGARRSHVSGMFAMEAGIVTSVGVSIGLLALFAIGAVSHSVAFIGAGAVALAGLTGGTSAALRAARVPFNRSGLFRAAPDQRSEWGR